MINQPQGPTPEDASQAPGDGQPTGDETQTFQAPVAALGDVKEGSVVACRVVSIDQDSGVATLSLDHDEATEKGGTDGMADEFESPGPNSASQMQPA